MPNLGAPSLMNLRCPPGTFLAWGALVSLLVCAGPAVAQGQRDPERTLARYRDYLERKPYHDWAFDKLVEAAVARNGLKELVRSYEEAQSEGNAAARVVLARLYARTDQVERGLEVLNQVEEETAEHLRLVGELHLEHGEPREALKAFDRAVKKVDPKRGRKLLGELHEARGKAALSVGEREQAAAAFRAMAALSPRSFNMRLEVASVLGRNGLIPEAIEELEVASRLAGQDAAKRCRVLAQQGRLHEQRLEVPAALSCYRTALSLMGRGNWLEQELQDRILAIHQRGGSLGELEARSRADVSADAQDVDARRFLARVLVAAGKPADATGILRDAVQAFPDDLKLGRDLIALLESQGDTDGQIVEYQRLLAEHPDQLELYLKLGQLFASEGRFEQASRQWQRTLAGRLEDASLCLRLAELYAFYQRVDDAVAMYEKAIALRPRDVASVGDLLRLLVRSGRAAQVESILERTTRSAGQDPARLREVSGLWREHGHPERALELVKASLAQREDPATLEVLADLQLEVGETPAALATLHRVIRVGGQGGRRKAAIDRILRLARRTGLDKLVASERAALDADPDAADALARRLVLAQAYVRQRNPAGAIRVLEQVLRTQPKLQDAHQQLARLYEDAGDYEKALLHHQAVLDGAPQNRRRTLLAIARIHLARYDQDKAFECYQDALRAAPDNPAAFKEVGEAYERIGRIQEARECLEQAVRLAPEDADLRIRLALTLRRQGDLARAKEHILAAVGSKDPDLRDEARERYYDLLSEEGRVGEEVEALRARIDANPYDVEAPLTLTDIYVRELEYELALEMLEKLLGYQPKHPGLLEQRARLLALMDRHQDAISDYEVLLKLPGGKRGRIALKIADQALARGDAERARQAMEAVGDPRKVARLYKEHARLDDAIAALREGISASPRDPRLYSDLGRLLRSTGDREGAAQAMERVLALRGDRWRQVHALGKLYHELEDSQRAVACGRRLFALIQLGGGPADEEDDDEKGKKARERRAAQRARWSATSDYRDKVRQIRDYFASQGKKEVFAELATRELDARPLNTALFDALVAHQLEESPQEALKVVTRVRRATAARGKHPPAFTLQGWKRRLKREALRCYGADPELAAFREGALASRTEDGGADADEWLERVELLDVQRRKQEALDVLRAGVQAHPRDSALLMGLATRLRQAGDHAGAVPVYRALLEVLAGRVETKTRDELAFRKQRAGLMQRFPSFLQRRVTEAHLRRLWRLTRSVSASDAWGSGVRVSVGGVRVALARSLVELERPGEAQEVLAGLEPKDPDRLRAWSLLVETAFDLDLFDLCVPVCERLARLEAELDADSILGHGSSWRGPIRQAMTRWARVLEKRGETLRAYDLLRTYGDAESAELLLTKAKAHDAAQAHYEEALAAAEAELSEAADEEVRHHHWLRVRELGIKLAEIHQQQRRWDAALALYERLLEHQGDEFTLHAAVATLHERAGRVAEAVATQWRIIERKREVRRQVGARRPRGRWITPTAPPSTFGEQDRWVWRNLARSGRSRGASGKPSVNANYAAILRLHLQAKEFQQAAKVLRQLAREDAATFKRLRYGLTQVIRNYRMGPAGLPVLRLLHNADRDNVWLNLEYAKALVAGKRLEEARKVYTAVLAKPGAQSYYQDQARQGLERIEARLEAKTPRTVEQLRAEADADPKNAKKRVVLVRRLMKERAFEAALREARVAQKNAPQLGELSALLESCLIVLGRRDALAEELRRQRKLAKSEQDRFTLSLRLANLHYTPGAGLTDAVRAELEESMRGGQANRRDYSAAGWLIERGLYEEAREMLAEDVKDLDKRGWATDSAVERLRQLEFVLGDPVGAIDGSWEKLSKAKALGDKTEAFQVMAGTLRLAPRVEACREPVFAAAKQHGGVRGDLYRGAYHLAARDLAAAQAALEAALQREPKETLYLYPVLIGIARAQRDWKGALGRVEALQALRATSADATVQTSVGSLSERDALAAERGSLLHRLDRVSEAKQAWSKLATGKARRRVQGALYEEHELYADAIAMIHSDLAKDGERNPGQLERLARLYTEVGEHAAAADALERARILTDPSNRKQLGSQLIAAHRSAGTLDAFRGELEARRSQDPTDDEALMLLARLYAESGDQERWLGVLRAIGERPTGRSALEQLATLHEAAGRLVEAAQVLERSLETGAVQDHQRRTSCRRIAGLYGKAGELDRGAEVLRDAFEDSESSECLYALGEHYAQNDQHAAAVTWFQQALAYDPKNSGLRQRLAGSLEEVGKPEEALEVLWGVVEEPKDAVNLAAREEQVVRLAAACGARAKLEAKGDDLPSRRRGALLDLFERKPGAADAFEALLAERPDDPILLAGRMLGLERAGKPLEALPVLDRLVDRLEREGALSTNAWQSRYAVESLHRRRARLLLEAGKEPEALGAFRTPFLDRFGKVEYWRYTYYNTPDTGLEEQASQLMQHGFWKQAVERWEKAALVSYGSYGDGYAKSLYRAGDREGALRLLWLDLDDPARDLAVGPGRNRFPNWSEITGQGNLGFLLTVHQEEGRMDALLERVRKLYEREPERKLLRSSLRSVLEASERWEELLTLERADPDREPDDVIALGREVRYLTELERWEEATAIQEKILALWRSRSSELGNVRHTVSSNQGGQGAVRFAFAKSQGSNTGGWSASWGGRGGDLFGNRRTLMALYRKVGRAEEARALEEKERVRGLGKAPALLTLARAYAALDLVEDTARLCAEARAADPDELSIADQTSSLLIELYARTEAPEALKAAVAERLQVFAAQLEEAAAYPWSLLEARARFVLLRGHGGGADLALAAADLERLLARSPRSARLLTLQALLWLRQGKAQEASAGFEAAAARARVEGGVESALRDYGWGLALARLEQSEQAAPRLRRALASQSDHALADAARDALEGE